MSDADDAKQEGMNRAEQFANAAWKKAAEVAVLQAALAKPLITADDVMQLIPSTVSTHELRALGPVMRNAARAKWIEKALDVPPKLCARPNCHSAPITVWRSLLAPVAVA